MSTMTTSEVLRAAAAELIAPKGKWTKGWCARNRSGREVWWNEDDASCWCASGAMYKAGADGSMVSMVINACAIDGLAGANDLPGTTQSDMVLYLLFLAEALQ